MVYRQTDRLIVVAIEEYPDVEQRSGSFSLTRLANEVVYQRYSDALKQLQDRGVMGHDSSRVLQVLYAGVPPSLLPSAVDVHLSPSGLHQRLNAVQQAAIARALQSNDVFVLHGPPGTGNSASPHSALSSVHVGGLSLTLCSRCVPRWWSGKTTTLVELIVQCVARGDRVLACAPSNIAVDNLVERIAAASAYNAAHAPEPSPSSPSSPAFHAFRCIRLGHPARLSPSVLSHSLDSVVAQSDGGQITRDIEQEMSAAQQSINTTKDRAEKKSLRSQWKALQKELRTRQRKAVKDSLDGCPVTCATLTGAATSACAAYRYDLVVVDEAAQAIEAACLIPILLCHRRLVLAGDHHQLGPVVKSAEAMAGGLGRTLMDRLTARADAASLMLMLDQQYRMNDDIMRWTSGEFYDRRLQAPEEVRQRRLTQLKGVKASHLTRAPLLFIDTAGCGMHEDEDDKPTASQHASLFAHSRSNRHEAALVLRHLRLLMAAGVPLSSITVLSPYIAQLNLLRDLLLPLYPGLEVGTIDSMQGRENDAVVISMVRSNDAGVVGFLSESRRMNVAITRARAHVCIIGDSDTVSRDRFLQRLVDYIANNDAAEYLSAVDYQDDALVVDAPAALPTQRNQPMPPAQPKQQPAVKAAPEPAAAEKVGAGAASAAVEVNVAAPVVETFDRKRITRLCEQVLAGELPSFTFPPSLTAEDRRLVHEVVEEVGQGSLQHVSEGRKHKRVIAISKQPPAAPAFTAPSRPPSSAAAASAPKAASRAPSASARGIPAARAGAAPSASREEMRLAALARMEAAAKPHLAKATEPVVGEAEAPSTAPISPPVRSMPSAFDALQGVVDGNEAEEEAKEEVADDEKKSTAPPEQPSPSQPPKASKARAGVSARKSGAAGSIAEDDEGLDDFLDGLSKGVSVCASPACTRPVMVNGAVCRYCNLRFCLGHANGILHGCAADAKQAALARDLQSLHSTRQGTQRVGAEGGRQAAVGQQGAEQSQRAENCGGSAEQEEAGEREEDHVSRDEY